MVNLKYSDEESKEYNDTMAAPRPAYPYGLCIYLDSETMEKLGIELPELDEVMEFKVKAQVTSLSANKTFDDDEQNNVSLQITDMEVIDEDDENATERRAKKLYKTGG